MNYRTFFSGSWIHEYVEFDTPSPSRWAIVALISEHPHQQTVRCATEELETPNPSYSKATFLCRNVREPSQQAFLRVYMQVPHRCTEDACAAIRSAQAACRSHDDIQALTLFRQEQAKHVPQCLGVKEMKQDISGWVPGGYISYLLWEKLPGVRLDEERFWSLERAERDAVREAFEPAYREMYGLGVKPLDCGLKHLLWDQDDRTLYIIGLGFTVPVSPDDVWHEKVLVEWGLAIPPKNAKWWEKDYVHEGTKDWTF